jgi:hypothetical protein
MEEQVITNVDLKRLSEEGERIYHEKLKSLLEPQYRGKIVAIEVESGDYFVEDSVVKAALKAKAKYPDKVFHFIRVSYRAVHKMR